MIDHVVAEVKEEQKIHGFRQYITESLRVIGENTAHLVQGGKYIAAQWGVDPQPQDNRTGDEIAADVINRLGLKFTDGGE